MLCNYAAFRTDRDRHGPTGVGAGAADVSLEIDMGSGNGNGVKATPRAEKNPYIPQTRLRLGPLSVGKNHN